MSEKTYQELIEARTARTLRTEAQLISNALFDETGGKHRSGRHQPRMAHETTDSLQQRHCNLRGGLRILRAFDKRMFDIATQSLAPDSGLRAVHTQELLQADRKIWAELASLCAEGWTLDEALRELTKVRSDLHALLQPRARAITVHGKGNKGLGGKGKEIIPTIAKTPNDPKLAAALQDLHQAWQ